MSKHISSRKASILNSLGGFEVDAFLITNITTLRYSTGFTGSAGNAVLTPDGAYFLTDFRYKSQLKEQVLEYEHVIMPTPLEGMKSLSIFTGGGRIAFEADDVPVSKLAEFEKNFPDVEWVPTSLIIERIAAIKDEEEIENIHAAAKIVDTVFTEILEFIKPGISENDISAEISYRTKKAGSEVDPFEPIIASGERSALPHGISSAKRIETGDFVVLDFGATIGGYAADMTRTVVIGEPSERHREIYAVVLEAQKTAVSAATDGITGADLDAVARKVITERGYGEYFGHALGHGLGLDVHTWPRVSSANKEPLLAGMAVTIEPGVYIPDFGGVRIEDDIVLTENGCRNLTGSPKDLISI